MSVRLNLKGISVLINDFKTKILNNFITQVTVINSSDILLSFSFYNKEKMLISLNHTTPFISMVDSDINFQTELGNLNENLRKYLKGSYVTDINQINGDRVIKFSLTKTNEFYQKEVFYLVIELIPTINNLLILNEDETILFAKHYTDLTASRPVLKGIKYQCLEKNKTLTEGEFDLNQYLESVNLYLNDLNNKTQKERALPLYNHLKQRLKSLNRKIKVLESEKLEAKEKLSYKEIGDTLLTLKYDEDNLLDYIKSISSIYDETISIEENAHRIYEKYKKYKRTIENDVREIEIAKSQVEELNYILSIFSYFTNEEIEELYEKYLPHKNVKAKKNKVVDHRLPYYINYKNTKIGFGKNKEQNNYLTFKKANKSDIYLHTSNYHGAHVIIFDNDPSKEVIEAASHLALILSNLTSGEVYIADVKDVKKGATPGEALLNKYQTITIHQVNDEYKKLLREQKRFGN